MRMISKGQPILYGCGIIVIRDKMFITIGISPTSKIGIQLVPKLYGGTRTPQLLPKQKLTKSVMIL